MNQVNRGAEEGNKKLAVRQFSHYIAILLWYKKLLKKKIIRINAINYINYRTVTITNINGNYIVVHAISYIQFLLEEQPLIRSPAIILWRQDETQQSQTTTLNFNALNKQNLHQISIGKTTQTTTEFKIWHQGLLLSLWFARGLKWHWSQKA